MKQFFKKCLEELELRAGIRQMHWLRQECADQADFDKKVELLIGSMVRVTDKFDYIPEEMQKKYILLELEQDQNYDGLNSRVIWKWLDRHKSSHMTHSQFSEVDLSQGKFYDELKPETKQLVDDFLRGLSDSLAVPKMSKEEVEMNGQEKPTRRASAYIPDPEIVKAKELHIQYIRENYDAITAKPKPNWVEEREWIKLKMK
jgi:hypothetical protein